MINFFKALSIILNIADKKYNLLKVQYISLDKSLNNISSKRIFSNKNVPSFKNSAMDGYAINIKNNQRDNGNKSYFKVTQKIYPGSFFEKNFISENEAIEIMTGARIPSKFNTVIKYEDTLKINDTEISVEKNLKLFENVKLIGDDIKIGDKIIEKGTLIGISEITVLSTIGIKYVNIFEYPHIYLINTGNEISENNNESNIISISNSSKFYIISFLKSINIKIKKNDTIKDNIKAFINKIKKIWLINNISIFLTTGAVSKGQSDFIPLILKLLGINIIFHCVNIKPGKPLLFGNFKNFIFFFCLPGNPISTVIGIRFFFYTFLMALLGQNLEEPIIIGISTNIKNKKDTFFKSVSFFEQNKLRNLISNDQESFKVKPMLNTNSFTFVKKNETNQYVYLNYIKHTKL